MKTWIFAVLIALVPTMGQAQTENQAENQAGSQKSFGHVASNVLEGYLLPVHHQFTQASEEMVGATEAFCAPDGVQKEKVEAVQQQFQALVSAWARIEYIRFGPVVVDHRYERLFFWPDRKGRGLRQVRRLLQAADSAELEKRPLSRKSVALQGLLALEFVLFDKPALFDGEETASYPCLLAGAISRTILKTATGLEKDWKNPEGYARLMLTPGKDNPIYRSDREAAQEMLTILDSGLENLRDRKILVAIGKDGKTPRPKRLPFWRSGNSLFAIKENIEGLSELYRATGFDQSLDKDTIWIRKAADFEFESSIKTMLSLNESILEAIKEPDNVEKLRFVTIVLGNLRALMVEDLSTALNLQAGFNAFDGD